MKRAGMRWNAETAQYLPALMSKAESDNWQQDVVNFITKSLGRKF
jgi:hypothetical protein